MTTPAQEDLKQSAPRVQSAARTVSILLEVARSENGLTTKEISERVGIGRQATYHLVHTLVETRMLRRAGGRRYVLGLRVAALVEGFGRQLAPGEHLAPIIRELAHVTGETSYATGWWANEITTLTVVQGTNPVRASEVPQGTIGYAHARASGKLLLAYATPSVRTRYLESHELTARTPHTKTDLARLQDEFDEIRELGYAEDHEEFTEGVCCIAVPLDGAASPFAIAVAVPRERFAAQRDRYLAELLQAARMGVSPAGD
jgi:IclR family transcriptional regulator, acetate operon repressor